MMIPSLTLATQTHADIILEMMRDYYAFDGHHFDPLRAREALLGILREPAFGRVWLISIDEEVAGYVVLTFGYSLEFLGRDAFIDELFLHERFRGRGIGTAIMEQVENEAHTFDIRSLHLEVVRANQNALRLYRKLGFHDREHYLMTKSIDRSAAPRRSHEST
jgi:ribosomal protein S18 acetylase RimI-like enzyme